MTKAHDLYSGLGTVQAKESTPASDSLEAITEGAEEDEGAAGAAPSGQEPTPAALAAETAASDRLKEKINQRKQEEQIAKEIARAEAIVATFDGVKVFMVLTPRFCFRN